MAKEKENKKILERVYIVPLRRGYLAAPNWKRTHKAVAVLRAFIAKHMKSDNVKIGKFLNDFLWKHGIKNPPHHVKINAVKYEDGKVMAEIFGKPIEEQKKPEPKEKKAKKPSKEAPSEEADKLEEKVEKIKEGKQEEAKKIQEEEIKELKDSHPKTHHPLKEAPKQKGQQLRKKEMIPKQHA